MARASYSRQLLDSVRAFVQPPPPRRASRRKSPNHLREWGGWVLAAVLAATMLVWNWKLFLATGIGMSVTVGAYLLSQSSWTVRWADVRRWLSDLNRPITVAVVGGGLSTVSTYMAAEIWATAENRWMAGGSILQGLATLGILLLLTWQTLSRVLGREGVNVNATLDRLSENDPLKQLVALRQLERWVTGGTVDVGERRTIGECCRVLLSRQLEPVVREAALETLSAVNAQAAPSLPEGATAAIDLRPSRKAATRKRKISL
ncbi:hypothetical protein [Baaleninema simplex]|uniref:hypothetical protein n=1 Tax=Baaleninema simplex TaxID=2862350 RepID=UPI0003731336|nr:hypothetical protein [Baaleninema simplex]